MILEPSNSVQKRKTALQTKAKGSLGYRFYLLYDKLCRKEVLEYAYPPCSSPEPIPRGGSMSASRKSWARRFPCASKSGRGRTRTRA